MATTTGVSVYLDDSSETINLFEDPFQEVTTVNGGKGDDVIRGNSLSNVLNGRNGDDQIWGGPNGDDTLNGDAGVDGYWWGYGGGHDLIIASTDDGGDALFLHNVKSGEYASYSNDDLHFSLSDGSSLDIKGWCTAFTTNRVQSFVFSDNTAYAWNGGSGAEINLFNRIYEDNHITHLVSIDAGNSTLRGGQYDDLIEGGAGDDDIWGGRSGTDTLAGGAGNDTYWFCETDGTDVIKASADNANDTVKFVDINMASLSRNGNDLELSTALGKKLILSEWYSADNDKINRFVFSDGTVKQIGANGWETIGYEFPGFNIVVDYSRYDSTGFFTGHPERQAVVEEACRIWEGIFTNDFENVPKGTTISVPNPNNGITDRIPLSSEIDDVLLFLGSSVMSGSTLGVSRAYSTVNTGNAELDRRYNSYDSIEPWEGSIAFNSNYAQNFYFDPTPSNPYDDTIPADKYDFLTVILHEMGHALGLGPQNAGSQYVTNDDGMYYFNGPHSLEAYGSPVPLDFASGSHIAASSSIRALMEPYLDAGERWLPTALDKAMFADIGYTIRE